VAERQFGPASCYVLSAAIFALHLFVSRLAPAISFAVEMLHRGGCLLSAVKDRHGQFQSAKMPIVLQQTQLPCCREQQNCIAHLRSNLSPDELNSLHNRLLFHALNEEWMAENSDVVDHGQKRDWEKFSEEFVGQE
jgi:hypothetical protein